MNHWESPITQIADEISEYYTQKSEDALITSVSQTIGYTVDKDELIKVLNYDRQQYEKGYEDGVKDGYTKAKMEYEDCISRAEAFKALKELEQEDIEAYGCEIPEVFNADRAIEKLRNLPSVEPKAGHWIVDTDNSRRWDRTRFYCSGCGDWQTYGKPRFCPNCGSRMDGGTE